MTRAPVATVAALRETAILFATLIAAFALKEKISWQRYLATGFIVAGVVIIRLS